MVKHIVLDSSQGKNLVLLCLTDGGSWRWWAFSLTSHHLRQSGTWKGQVALLSYFFLPDVNVSFGHPNTVSRMVMEHCNINYVIFFVYLLCHLIDIDTERYEGQYDHDRLESRFQSGGSCMFWVTIPFVFADCSKKSLWLLQPVHFSKLIPLQKHWNPSLFACTSQEIP